uniref:Uncharacterized protein n=1 Tax=Zea mays TaxID=4577 RepID=A0A804P1I8_MAIZE
MMARLLLRWGHARAEPGLPQASHAGCHAGCTGRVVPGPSRQLPHKLSRGCAAGRLYRGLAGAVGQKPKPRESKMLLVSSIFAVSEGHYLIDGGRQAWYNHPNMA